MVEHQRQRGQSIVGPWWGHGVTSHNSTIDSLLSFEIARLGRFATAVHERKGVSS